MKNIERVKEMLEQRKTIDETQQYMEHLNEVVAAGRATLSTYAEMSENDIIVKERILNFIESFPNYSGNPEKVFEWCENLETHLFNCKWKMIPNEDVKRMLGFCIKGPA